MGVNTSWRSNDAPTEHAPPLLVVFRQFLQKFVVLGRPLDRSFTWLFVLGGHAALGAFTWGLCDANVNASTGDGKRMVRNGGDEVGSVDGAARDFRDGE